jgi:hypothetical protein
VTTPLNRYPTWSALHLVLLGELGVGEKVVGGEEEVKGETLKRNGFSLKNENQTSNVPPHS